jgi:Ca2+-binding EF-hand superfamily protein
MLVRKNIVRALFALLIASGVMVAQTTASVPKSQNKLALGETQIKQLLLLMDTNKDGQISKQEYMKFMEAEFDRLDKNHNGELDVKELTRSRLQASHFTSAGK